MMEAFKYFDKVYCINLESRPDRWQESVDAFASVGITNYERIPGVVASSGRVGCIRAICNSVEKALAAGYESVLICEDDIHFPRDPEHTNNKLNAALQQLPSDWDALYLGATLTDQFHARPVEKYSQDLLRLISAFTTHAIAYSKKGLDALISGIDSSAYWGDTISAKYDAIDIYLAKDYLIKNNCYIVNELLCVQRSGYSDICHNHQNYLGLMQDAFNRFTTT